MDEFSNEQREAIVRALEAKNAKLPCPRCGTREFSLIGGYFNHFVQPQLGGVSIGGPSIPTAVVACNNCGWLSEHALGALGLLPAKEKSEAEAKS